MPLKKVEQYTLQKRIEIVKVHYKNGDNFAETVRTRKNSIAEKTIQNLSSAKYLS